MDAVKRMLINIGGKLMGQEDAANKAFSEFLSSCSDEDPRAHAWNIFIGILKKENILQDAFISAWPSGGVVRYAIGNGLSIHDAEDISQAVAIDAWLQFEKFKPYLSSWNTWILAIAKNKIYNFRRDTEKYRTIVNVDNITIPVLDSLNLDKEIGWSIPIVCKEWMSRGDIRMGKFAHRILMAYYNVKYTPPTSYEMARITGVSRKTCLKMFRQFAIAVMVMETYNES